MYSIECLITQGIAHTYICMYIQEIVVNPRQLNSNFLQINFIVYNIHIGLTSYIKITSVRGFASWAKRSLSMNYRTCKGLGFLRFQHTFCVKEQGFTCSNKETNLHNRRVWIAWHIHKRSVVDNSTYFQHKSGNFLMC